MKWGKKEKEIKPTTFISMTVHFSVKNIIDFLVC